MTDSVKNCLEIEDLTVSFTMQKTASKAVRNLSFSVPQETTLCIVGESGCGKSMTALSIMRLIPQPPGKIESGRIHFDGNDLLKLPENQMRDIRGKQISMIFQDPMTSLNPVFTCGSQIRESIEHHGVAPKGKSGALVEKLLTEVGIEHPNRIASSYPHQLSGGMRQRVMIAMALACSPKLLIADEPTTALDVTVQARILDLLHHLQNNKKMSMILITHNLGIVGDIAHWVMVMYAGEMMEYTTAGEIFSAPLHPYTVSLLETLPSLECKKDRLTVIPGEVPIINNMPPGCPFHPRCSRATARCAKEHPDLYTVDNNHKVRCFLYDK